MNPIDEANISESVRSHKVSAGMKEEHRQSKDTELTLSKSASPSKVDVSDPRPNENKIKDENKLGFLSAQTRLSAMSDIKSSKQYDFSGEAFLPLE